MTSVIDPCDWYYGPVRIGASRGVLAHTPTTSAIFGKSGDRPAKNSNRVRALKSHCGRLARAGWKQLARLVWRAATTRATYEDDSVHETLGVIERKLEDLARAYHYQQGGIVAGSVSIETLEAMMGRRPIVYHDGRRHIAARAADGYCRDEDGQLFARRHVIPAVPDIPELAEDIARFRAAPAYRDPATA